jgi:hypothetical protein
MEGLANVGMACEDMGSIGSAEWSRQVMWDCTARAKIREVRYPVPQLHSYPACVSSKRCSYRLAASSVLQRQPTARQARRPGRGGLSTYLYLLELSFCLLPFTSFNSSYTDIHACLLSPLPLNSVIVALTFQHRQQRHLHHLSTNSQLGYMPMPIVPLSPPTRVPQEHSLSTLTPTPTV